MGIAFYILDAAAVAVPFLKAEQIDKGKINVHLLVNFIKEGRKICYYNCSAPINVKLGEAGRGVLKENLKSFFQLLYMIFTFRLFINENSMVNAMYGVFVITAFKSWNLSQSL